MKMEGGGGGGASAAAATLRGRKGEEWGTSNDQLVRWGRSRRGNEESARFRYPPPVIVKLPRTEPKKEEIEEEGTQSSSKQIAQMPPPPRKKVGLLHRRTQRCRSSSIAPIHSSGHHRLAQITPSKARLLSVSASMKLHDSPHSLLASLASTPAQRPKCSSMQRHSFKRLTNKREEKTLHQPLVVPQKQKPPPSASPRVKVPLSCWPSPNISPRPSPSNFSSSMSPRNASHRLKKRRLIDRAETLLHRHITSVIKLEQEEENTKQIHSPAATSMMAIPSPIRNSERWLHAKRTCGTAKIPSSPLQHQTSFATRQRNVFHSTHPPHKGDNVNDVAVKGAEGEEWEMPVTQLVEEWKRLGACITSPFHEAPSGTSLPRRTKVQKRNLANLDDAPKWNEESTLKDKEEEAEQEEEKPQQPQQDKVPSLSSHPTKPHRDEDIFGESVLKLHIIDEGTEEEADNDVATTKTQFLAGTRWMKRELKKTVQTLHQMLNSPSTASLSVEQRRQVLKARFSSTSSPNTFLHHQSMLAKEE